ncbi:MAG: hypothetical protein ACOZIN_16165 [Myxococcota bacterium]
MRLPLALLLLVGCGPTQVVVTMNAENNSGQSGLATLTDKGDKTRVEVSLDVSTDPGPQPVHIHEGRCGEIGGKVLGGTGMAQLTLNEGNLVSDSEIAVPLSKLLGGTHAINAHFSADLDLYVSCGNIP